MRVDPEALSGQVAIVTGSSKGIGRTLAVGLSAGGASVVVNFKSDRDGAEETCRLIREGGGTAVAVGADVSSPVEASELVQAAVHSFGRLDILVNNAGRTRFGPASEVTVEDWEDVINTNLRGTFFMTVAAAAAMDGVGSIVNMSSCAATLMVVDHAVYTTSKGGVEAMTRQLAIELAPRIRVNALSPAATSMERNWQYDPNFDQGWADVTPMARVAQPDDYVAPLIFLASDASAFVTGEVLHVDGGWTIKGHHPDMTSYDYKSDRGRD